MLGNIDELMSRHVRPGDAIEFSNMVGIIFRNQRLSLENINILTGRLLVLLAEIIHDTNALTKPVMKINHETFPPETAKLYIKHVTTLGRADIPW